jgi:hypothetical protein
VEEDTMKKQNNEIMGNMEFLIKELHKEWDRTGAYKASVFISLSEVDGVNRKLAKCIMTVQQEAENGELTFKESIRKSKECYVLLRLARKIKQMEDKTNKKAMDEGFYVNLDKEEMKLFKKVFKEDLAG